jgi:hypothetical protein
MKRPLMLTSLLAAVALVGCDSGPNTPAKGEAVPAAPKAKALSAPVTTGAPKHVITTGPAPSVEPAGVNQTPAEARKAHGATRDLMNQTMAYMNQNRLDLAAKNLETLKAKCASRPEYLQIQVDRMEALLKTGAVSEPQRSLKAAILQSQAQQK